MRILPHNNVEIEIHVDRTICWTRREGRQCPRQHRYRNIYVPTFPPPSVEQANRIAWQAYSDVAVLEDIALDREGQDANRDRLINFMDTAATFRDLLPLTSPLIDLGYQQYAHATGMEIV